MLRRGAGDLEGGEGLVVGTTIYALDPMCSGDGTGGEGILLLDVGQVVNIRGVEVALAGNKLEDEREIFGFVKRGNAEVGVDEGGTGFKGVLHEPCGRVRRVHVKEECVAIEVLDAADNSIVLGGGVVKGTIDLV